MESRLEPTRAAARWWVGRFDLLWRLEVGSLRRDRTIRRLPSQTLRRQPDLRRHWESRGLFPWDVLAYQATAEGRYGTVRLAAAFLGSPFDGGHPDVFALDGDRRSLHRNPPFDAGEQGVSAHL